MNPRLMFGLGLIIMLSVGFGAGWFLSGYVNKAMVSADAKAQAMRITVTVVDTNETFFFNVEDPMTKVLFWQSGGQLLEVTREDVDWEMTLGHEDWPSQGVGDCTDVILKVAKIKATGVVRFEVACLGSWNKKVYMDKTILELDTSMGARWKAWSG